MAITTLESLRQHLQFAIEIEHATLPPYLCALYSIKEGCNQEAAEVIQSVLMEEMLHLTLACNLLNAVGGAPQLDTPTILPTYPAHLPHSNRAFQVPLTKFSPEAIATFMRIEKPSDHAGLPEDDAFETIGQFYEAIGESLARLTRDLGEREVFRGDRARQVRGDQYYGGSGRIIEVVDLASAAAALAEIVDQGEGLRHREIWDGDRDMHHPERDEIAHYFRFDEIRVGRRYRKGDSPRSGPTGAPFAVDWGAVHDMRPNPRSQDYPPGSEIRERMEQFNRSYSALLHLLHECFNGSPRLLAVATGAMYGLKDQAIALMKLPTGIDGTTAGPSFEYVPREQRQLTAPGMQKVVVVRDGPYVVYGHVPLVRKKKIVSDNGRALTWVKTAAIATEDTYALCRCGRSGAKPFCDGTHARIAFDGTETADPRPTEARQRALDGPGLVVKRDETLCMGAAFCVGRLKKIPDMLADAADSDVRAHVIGMIERCPSGSYSYALDSAGPAIEPDLAAAVAVTADEGPLAGCLWITGGVPIQRSDGQPFEARNRVTLCRCGGSKKKPLCDGTHRAIGFRDPAAEPPAGTPVDPAAGPAPTA